MRTVRGQRGLGIVGLVFLLALIGIVALLVIKSVPIYLNEMTIQRDLRDIANKAGTGSGGEVDPAEIRSEVQRRWDIDYVTQLQPKDIKVTRGSRGYTISYDYEAREHLFYNIFLVIHFAEEIPVVISKSSAG